MTQRRFALALAWLAFAAPLPTLHPAEPAAADRPADEDATARPRFHAATEVVASRVVGDPAEVGRREVVLERAEIARLPAASVQDVLALLPGVGLARRGARGVQGDLNLRGSTFEQALVLVNGLRVNNPQTGHHNLDLFIPLAAVERIEVLYGPGSATRGPDAFGGAVNIVTSAPPASATLRLGDFGLAGGAAAMPLGAGWWAAAEREVHTGFRAGTEADVNQAAAGWSWSDRDRRGGATLAAGERDFGAFAFYSSLYPDQRESTSGKVLTARAALPAGAATLDLALRVDGHRDVFVLDRMRPDWFRNSHRTRGALVSLSLAGAGGSWSWAAGVEGARDEISSSNLGDHHRARTALFGELAHPVGGGSLGLQARLDSQQPWGTQATVSLGGGGPLGGGLRLRGHLGTSFRAPSFTELHYASPSRLGNPDLEPERGRTVELGLDRGPLSVTAFRRTADPIIDYLLGDDGVWRAANLGRVVTDGLELMLALPPVGRCGRQRVGVTRLASAIAVDPGRSAYALAHPHTEAAWTGACDIGGGWSGDWAVRWREPRAAGSWAVLDLRVSRALGDGLTASVEASNLLDRDITELHGVPLPGRWVSVALSWHRR